MFDLPIEGICDFEQTQLSPKGDRLLLNVPTDAVNATSAYIIEIGTRRGDDHLTYPFIHARPDGQPIREISVEWPHPHPQ